MAVWLIHPEVAEQRPTSRQGAGAAAPPAQGHVGRNAAAADRPSTRPALLAPALINVFDSLTPRERELVTSAARGRNNAQIAAGTSVSLFTVETQIRGAMTKLGVRDRTQLAGYAARAGLLG